MKSTSFKTLYISSALVLFSLIVPAQEGHVTVHQDPEISNLLKLKKEINGEDTDGERYKINIYSGSHNSAKNAQNGFHNVFAQWPSKLDYETPNYKVYVGFFRTRLEADRALIKIKRKFSSAFILPKKN